MSYVVLARKYRPQNFNDVAAQEHVSRTLKNSIINDRLASGYLFCGPRGTGKTTTARILAKCLNCINGPTVDPCDNCSACHEISSGTSLDVLEIDAASNTGVDDVRTLKENVRYMPTGGKMRIFIIDEVHRLSGAAFDALLKTLEEPPPHVIFILATTEPMKVPETILSRTQRFDFKRVSTTDLTEHLKKIANLEKIEITEAALSLLARKGDGSVRDALSLLDQIIAFAGDKITEKDIVEGLGLVDRQFLFEFVSSVASKNDKQVLANIKKIFDSGTDITDFINELLEHFRILMVLSVTKESSELLELSSSEIDEFIKQAEFFQLGDIIRLMKMIADMNQDIRFGLNERMVVELQAVKMANMESTVMLRDVLNSISSGRTTSLDSPTLFNNIEKKKSLGLSSDNPSLQSEHRQLRITRKEELNKTVPPVSINLPQLQIGWESFLNVLRGKSPMLSSHLKMTEISEFKNNCLKLSFDSSGDFAREVVEKTDNKKLINDTLNDFFKTNISIMFDIDITRNDMEFDNKAVENRKTDIKKLLENSPKLKELIKKVDGEIIGIRNKN